MTDSALPPGSVGGRAGENYVAVLRRALVVQCRVVFALFMREAVVRRGRAYVFGWAAAGLEPLLIIGTVTLFFSLMNHAPSYGTSELLFVGTGVFPVYMFIHTTMRVREAFLSSHLARYPIEMPLDEVLVHIVLHLVSSTIIAVAYFAVLYYGFGVHDALPFDLSGALAALSALFLFGVAVGLFNTMLARLVPFWGTVWPAISRAALHFSGLYFVAAYLSPNIRQYFAMNPVLHGVNWFRQSFYPFYPKVITDHGFLLMTSLVMVTLALCLERIIRNDIFSGEQS